MSFEKTNKQLYKKNGSQNTVGRGRVWKLAKSLLTRFVSIAMRISGDISNWLTMKTFVMKYFSKDLCEI